jgi:uncharacterized protein (UPF0276 family)
MSTSAAIPARAGVGFKPQHFAAISASAPALGWFEVHAENYMGEGGLPHRQLEAIWQAYPLSIHGVGLSIGGAEPLDEEHLGRLAAVVRRYEPGLISEHLAWSRHGGLYFNDLLPVPYTEAALRRVVERIDRVQSVLRRPILLENPSTYVRFEASALSEVEFLREVAARSGCGLLLDVNNVLVSATNHDYSAQAYLDAFPLERVGAIHLAGHAAVRDEHGRRLLIDAHDRPVSRAVWALYARVIGRGGPLPSLIEWDKKLPDWQTLHAEARIADRMLSADTGGISRVAC